MNASTPQEARTLEAIEKMKAILREYDLWAALTVIDEERVHFAYHVDPSWSCLYINDSTGEARIRAKKADFATPEQHARVIRATAGAIIGTKDLAAQQFAQMESLQKLVAGAGIDAENVYSDPKMRG